MPVDRAARNDPRQRRAAQRLPPYVKTIPSGTASPIVVYHQRGTRDVFVETYVAESPYVEVSPRVEHTDKDTVTLIFGGALAWDLRVVVGDV